MIIFLVIFYSIYILCLRFILKSRSGVSYLETERKLKWFMSHYYKSLRIARAKKLGKLSKDWLGDDY